MAATQLPDWYRRFFRIGHLTKGIIYGIIAGLVLATVFTVGGQVEGSRGVIGWIEEQPFGRILLGITTIGIFCYAAWRLLKSFYGKGGSEDDKKDVIYRIAWFISGLLYVSLGVAAVRTLLKSSGGTAGGGNQQELIQSIMKQSWGPAAVVVMGVIVVGVAIYQFRKGIKRTFMDQIGLEKASHTERKTIKRLGTTGLVARGVVFAIIAYFLIMAGITVDPDKFKGTADALKWLREHTYGTILLGLAGAGLLAYAIFMVAKAKYPPSQVE